MVDDVSDFVTLEDLLAQSLGCAHRVEMRAYIRRGECACMFVSVWIKKYIVNTKFF